MIDHKLLNALNAEIDSFQLPQQPAHLYDPLRYILSLGGKRLRPLLTLMGCRLFGGDVEKALSPALAIEFFHNFSLIHDDIMDDAPLRRGKETVHEKWDLNVGILSGDALLVEAYKKVAEVDAKVLPKVLEVFSRTATQVCEGQQYDMDFESTETVTEKEYIGMIQYKTSVLLGCALQIGALVAYAEEEETEKLYQFGLKLGTAFQIKDDYLDAFGDPEKFGKQVGGDILCNKKTILLISALNKATDDQLAELKKWMNISDRNEEKVEAVKALYQETGADKYILERMEEYYRASLAELDGINLSAEQKLPLYEFAQWLHERDL